MLFRRRFSSTAGAGSARFTRAIRERRPENTTRNASMTSKAPSINSWRSRGPDMPSFDVVSEIDTHELTNAVDQAVRELTQRFDFKGTDATFEVDETTVTMSAPADFQLKQMLDILKLRIAKRGIDVACLEVKDPDVNLAKATRDAVVLHGIDVDTGPHGAGVLKDSRL